MRVICIGLREKHDREVLKLVTDWALTEGHADLFKALTSKRGLDLYDMTTMPKKGDAIAGLRKHEDTIAVIGFHLFGLDEDMSDVLTNKHYKNDTYCYTKENHRLLELCLNRNIPLICWGDQPFRKSANIPNGIEVIDIGELQMSNDGRYYGQPMPIKMYVHSTDQ